MYNFLYDQNEGYEQRVSAVHNTLMCFPSLKFQNENNEFNLENFLQEFDNDEYEWKGDGLVVGGTASSLPSSTFCQPTKQRDFSSDDEGSCEIDLNVIIATSSYQDVCSDESSFLKPTKQLVYSQRYEEIDNEIMENLDHAPDQPIEHLDFSSDDEGSCEIDLNAFIATSSYQDVCRDESSFLKPTKQLVYSQRYEEIDNEIMENLDHAPEEEYLAKAKGVAFKMLLDSLKRGNDHSHLVTCERMRRSLDEGMKYTAMEKQDAIALYKEKKSRRIWKKRIVSEGKKMESTRRPRDKGKFVKVKR